MLRLDLRLYSTYTQLVIRKEYFLDYFFGFIVMGLLSASTALVHLVYTRAQPYGVNILARLL